MTERFPLYQYEIRRPDEAVETRWSFVPVKPAGYAGNDEPSDAHPMGSEPGDVGELRPAAEVEAPDGSSIVSYEPPILQIPGRGRVDLVPLLEPSGSAIGDLAEAVRVRHL